MRIKYLLRASCATGTTVRNGPNAARSACRGARQGHRPVGDTGRTTGAPRARAPGVPREPTAPRPVQGVPLILLRLLHLGSPLPELVYNKGLLRFYIRPRL